VSPSSRRESHRLAAELLLIVAGRHHLWPAAAAADQPIVSKALGACLVLWLLSVVQRLAWALGHGSKVLAGVLMIAAWYQAQALVCSLSYLVEPWPVLPGQGLCTGRIGFDLGAIGLVLIAVAASSLSRLTGEAHGDNA
jgi:hypothetical protein